MSPIVELLRQAPEGAPLLMLPDRTLSYADVLDRSAAVAEAFVEKGIKAGDKVAVLLPNGADWFIVMAACARMGATMVSLNQRLGAKEIGDFVQRTHATALVYDPEVREGALEQTIASIDPASLSGLKMIAGSAPIGIDLPDVRTLRLDEIADDAPDWKDNGAAADPFWIVPTSGTTSLPKLVVHIQERVARHTSDVAKAFGLGPESVVMLTIPLCGGFGFTIAMTAIAAGAPIVLREGFDPAETGKLMREYGVTDMYGTNDMLAAILEASVEDWPFPSLKLYGHANFTPGLVDLPAEAERRGVFMRGMYGLSEAMAFVSAQPMDAPLAIRSEGGGELTCPDAEFRVADLDSGEVVAPGEAGELQLRTPNCMIEYFEDPERTALAFTDDGYLRTGDVVEQLEDGTFVFLSRAGDMLRIGGYLVSPAEIEDVIKAAGPVASCQVVAITQGQRSRPVAFAVADRGETLDEATLASACERELAIYKRPLRIFEIDKMPVVSGPNGDKVQKNVLRDRAVALLEETE